MVDPFRVGAKHPHSGIRVTSPEGTSTGKDGTPSIMRPRVMGFLLQKHTCVRVKRADVTANQQLMNGRKRCRRKKMLGALAVISSWLFS